LSQDNEVIAALESVDWAVFSSKLVAYARWYGRRYQWNSAGTDTFANGETPADIVQRVIEKAYSGKRRWNSNIPLELWFKKNIESEISNLYTKKSHQSETAFISSSEQIYEEKLEQEFEYEYVGSEVFPQAVLPSPEEVVLYQEVEAAAFAAATDDVELERLLMNILEIGGKPQDLAEAMGKPVVEIYNLLRRFYRRMERLKDND
jgi:DNA-directed RNA polymerase specialized sigma24 family protein